MCVCMHNREPAARAAFKLKYQKFVRSDADVAAVFVVDFFYKSLVFVGRDDDAAGAVGCAAASCTRRTFAVAHSRCDRVELHNVDIRGLRRLRLQETLNNLRNFTHTTVPPPPIVYKNKKAHNSHTYIHIKNTYSRCACVRVRCSPSPTVCVHVCVCAEVTFLRTWPLLFFFSFLLVNIKNYTIFNWRQQYKLNEFQKQAKKRFKANA